MRIQYIQLFCFATARGYHNGKDRQSDQLRELTDETFTKLLVMDDKIIGERDTLRDNSIENRGCLFMCLDVHMSFCTLTLSYLCVSSVFDPVPNVH